MPKQVAPYGSWKSPITSAVISAGTNRLGQCAYDQGSLYWIEGRPTEGGRQVIVRRLPDGTIEDVLPPEYNARSLVHEYGGGAFAVRDGRVFFSNFTDQRLYLIESGKQPRAITVEGKFRYADAMVDTARNRIICVREDHTVADHEATTTIVEIPIETGVAEARILVSGSDFYSNPRLSPKGMQLLWLSWNHPNMPWDGTELWVANLNDAGALVDRKLIAGGQSESIFQPEWAPDGTLYFISDANNWWNLYACDDPFGKDPLHVADMERDFGLPQWVFGMSTYVPVWADQLLCTYNENGMWRLARIDADVRAGRFELFPMESSGTEFVYFATDGQRVAFNAGSPGEQMALLEMNLVTKEVTKVRASCQFEPDPGYISPAEVLEFPTDYGRTAFAFFYPPTNLDFEAPHGELPPLLLKSHGGPTGSASSALNLSIQYWTSRGFAVVDVNYGGSTGFGRHYRERLQHRWGLIDVADCQHAARHLAEQKKVDGGRKAITGGSAGGFTTLCALTFGETFQAGASHYGVGDLEALIRDTHKFESRYGDQLIGPYPEHKDRYFERSPINFTDRLMCPVIFFQGLEDKAVPPNQAQAMVDALRKQKRPVAYIAYAGEQHGFRKAENIKRTLDAELYFYSRVFGFELADPVEPVEIENLSEMPVSHGRV